MAKLVKKQQHGQFQHAADERRCSPILHFIVALFCVLCFVVFVFVCVEKRVDVHKVQAMTKLVKERRHLHFRQAAARSSVGAGGEIARQQHPGHLIIRFRHVIPRSCVVRSNTFF